MKIEERLHDAMHEYADTIEPEPGSWSSISDRFDDTLPPVRQPSRRPLVLAGVALALIVVLITTLVVRDDGEEGRVVTDPSPIAAMPARILAITDGGQAAGRPEILDSATGAREEAFVLGGIAAGTQVAVGTSGRDSFVVLGDGNKGCADHRIQHWPLVSSTEYAEPIANATSPTVSPDGRYLAYLHCLPGDARADEIVLRDLTTGSERTTPAPQGTFFMNRLEFAADSRHVLFDLFDDALGRDSLREIDLVGGEAPPGRDLGVAVGGEGWVGVRGTTGEYLGVKGSPPSVLSMRGPSPITAGPLFTVPGIPTQVVSDQSGRHILALVDGALYRWSVGDNEPTKIADGVIGAAWIPDAPAVAPPPAPAPGSMPENIVTGINGRLWVLGAQEGQQRGSLGLPESFGGDPGTGAVPGISSLSSRADAAVGATSVFFTSTGRSGACGDDPGPTVNMLTAIADPVQQPQVFRTLEARRLVGGAQAPVVSPNGEFVAYGIVCDGHTLGMTLLRDAANFRADPLGVTTREASEKVDDVEVLGWSRDSNRLLYRLSLRGDAAPHYYLGRLWPAVRQSETQVIEIPSGSNIAVVSFVDDETIAVAVRKGGGTVVHFTPIREVDGSRLEPPTVDGLEWDATALLVTGDGAFEVPGRITTLVADDSGRHFLAVVDDGSLYRWSVGDPEPTKLADGVTAAAWMPDPPGSESSVRFGADARIPRDFPSGVPLPDAGPLRSVVSEKNPPNASFTMTYALGGRDGNAVGDAYRRKLENAGFKIEHFSAVGGSDSEITQFDAIGKKWDVAVVSGNASPEDRATISVQVHTHGQIMSGISGIGDTRPDVVAPPG